MGHHDKTFMCVLLIVVFVLSWVEGFNDWVIEMKDWEIEVNDWVELEDWVIELEDWVIELKDRIMSRVVGYICCMIEVWIILLSWVVLYDSVEFYW